MSPSGFQGSPSGASMQGYGAPSFDGGMNGAAASAASKAAEIAARLAGNGTPPMGGAGEKRDYDGTSGAGDDGESRRSTNRLTSLLTYVSLAICSAPRKRRSRWGDAPATSNVATAITGAVSVADLDRYAVSVRLDEISQKLRSGDVVPSDRERSPSPPPTYDGQGRRTNTREVRYRKKLEDERVQLVEKQLRLDPNYKPPAEYHATKRNRQPMEKVYLPLKEFPEINFFGLLVGPRGNTLKNMERESGAKIAIRGKGSVKEGKGRGSDENEEDMHCVISADDESKIKLCIRLINKVIETAASTPESQNDHKRNQLRELATLNGTLRDDENQVCQNCGMKGHRRFECTEQRNFTAHVICHRCGGQGHLARDCTQPRQGFGAPGGPGGGAYGMQPGNGASGVGGSAAFDSEYASLMAELGESGTGRAGSGTPAGAGGAAGGVGPSANAGGADAPRGPDGKKIPPWRQPDIWASPGFHGGGGQGFGGPRGPRFGQGHGHGGFGGPGGHAATGANAHGPMGGQGWGGAHNAMGGYQGGSGGGWGQQQQQQQQQPAPGGDQRDYSAEWAAYYAQQAQQQQTGDAAGSAGASGQGGEQKDYTKEWEE